MGFMLAALAAKTIIPTAELPPSNVDPCIALDREESYPTVTRFVTTADLVSIGDIGRSDPHESPSPFGISPDGTQIAFLVRRGNPAENEYCQRLMTIAIAGASNPKELDRGGSLIRTDFQLRKFVSIQAGSAKVITPRWSPDGRRIAFLKQVGEKSQIWLVDSDASKPASRVTNLPDSVDDFAWTNSGEALVAATRPGIRLQAEQIAREARTGFVFDERFAPDKADRPIPIEPVTTEYSTVELDLGKTRQSTPAEIELVSPERPKDAPASTRGFAISAKGIMAWRNPIRPLQLLSPTGLTMKLADGSLLKCDELCNGTKQIWWAADGLTLYASQRTGWGGSQTAILRWKAGEKAPSRTMITDDALVGCDLTGKELICAREGALRPRRLVAINPDNGRERTVFDPNPAFRHIQLGKVQRLKVRNANGVESWADLVLPPFHQAGDRHPLILVQYHSNGFLRGGTGDEFPVQLFAAKGFAVLSFSRPEFVPAAMVAETELELMTTNRRDWTDRRNVQSSVEVAIARAIATGAVDHNRIGITGFSDGTTTTAWALINSSLFKVAALGTCCEGFGAFPLAAGPTYMQQGRIIGYRYGEADVESHWKPLSLPLNADRIDAPILIQTGDSEYEGSLDVVDTYKHRGKAIELYVFEGEPHIKYQPAHRFAMYDRSAEWFQFWMMQRMNCDPAKAAQYKRWKAMKNAPSAEKLKCETGPLALP